MKTFIVLLIIISTITLIVVITTSYLYPEIIFAPHIFINEYLKFIGTLISVILGWFLIHVIWMSQLNKNAYELKKNIVLGFLDVIAINNSETIQLIADSNESIQYRDSQVKNNVKRQFDQIQLLFDFTYTQIEPYDNLIVQLCQTIKPDVAVLKEKIVEIRNSDVSRISLINESQLSDLKTIGIITSRIKNMIS